MPMSIEWGPMLLPFLLLLITLVSANTAAVNVTVFQKHEAGYYCIKIPYLLPLRSGLLLAFAEARGKVGAFGCADWSATDLVVKTSLDQGRTWSSLRVVYGNSTLVHC